MIKENNLGYTNFNTSRKGQCLLGELQNGAEGRKLL